MIWLDHAVRVVPDFAATERRFRDKFGLEAARWEVFPDSGVASRLFVLGNAGIELMGVRDAAVAAEHAFGRLVRERPRNLHHRAFRRRLCFQRHSESSRAIPVQARLRSPLHQPRNLLDLRQCQRLCDHQA